MAILSLINGEAPSVRECGVHDMTYNIVTCCGRRDTTLVIHDWGSFLGYQFMHLYPSLMTRVVSFDIGSGGHGCLQTNFLAKPRHARPLR